PTQMSNVKGDAPPRSSAAKAAVRPVAGENPINLERTVYSETYSPSSRRTYVAAEEPNAASTTKMLAITQVGRILHHSVNHTTSGPIGPTAFTPETCPPTTISASIVIATSARALTCSPATSGSRDVTVRLYRKAIQRVNLKGLFDSRRKYRSASYS